MKGTLMMTNGLQIDTLIVQPPSDWLTAVEPVCEVTIGYNKAADREISKRTNLTK